MFDGPFTETREVLGGSYLIETTDLAAALALALAEQCPEEVVEVRPVVADATDA